MCAGVGGGGGGGCTLAPGPHSDMWDKDQGRVGGPTGALHSVCPQLIGLGVGGGGSKPCPSPPSRSTPCGLDLCANPLPCRPAHTSH